MPKTYRWTTTQDAIDNLKFGVGKSPAIGDLMKSDGFTDVGDGGKGTWEHLGGTGQTPSQSPADLGDALFNDPSGFQWAIVADGGAINAEALGPHDTGNDNEVFKALLNCGTNIHTVKFGAGNWDILGNATTVTQSFQSKTFVSANRLTTITFTNPDSTFRTMLKLSADGVSFRGIKFIGVGNGGSFAFFNPVADNFKATFNEFDGGITGAAGSPSHLVYVISISSSGSLDNIKFNNNDIHHVARTYLQTNTSTTTVTDQTYNDNKFSFIYEADLSFNAPSGNVSGVKAFRNKFSDSVKLGGTGAHYFGLASVSKVRFGFNELNGVIDNPIHIEENSNDLIIDSNIFEVSPTGSFGAISLQDNDIGGSPEKPDDVIISNNVIRKLGTQKEANSVGINLLFDGTGTQPASNVKVHNNTVIGFETGYIPTGSPDDAIAFTDNLASECGTGYELKDKVGSIKGNTSSHCDVGVTSGTGGDVENHTFIECPVIATAPGGVLQLINPTYEFDLFTTPGGSSVFKPIIEELSTDRANGTMSVNVQTSSGADYAAIMSSVDFDGTTSTLTSLQTITNGGASANITSNGGFISASIFTASARTAVKLYCKFNGFVMINT